MTISNQNLVKILRSFPRWPFRRWLGRGPLWVQDEWAEWANDLQFTMSWTPVGWTGLWTKDWRILPFMGLYFYMELELLHLMQKRMRLVMLCIFLLVFVQSVVHLPDVCSAHRGFVMDGSWTSLWLVFPSPGRHELVATGRCHLLIQLWKHHQRNARICKQAQTSKYWGRNN